ncbi:hypothetical protein KYY02_29555 [Streptomyces pimonensis]|uniref:Uncharacterized protein n=1 Tax=Streptomyces pimonensis TaxID=2860288 RepID=A0ABV4J6X6_9ACTN
MTSDLERKAYEFAQELQSTLNATICRDVRIKAVQRPFEITPVFTVGSGPSRQNLTQPRGFPVRIDHKKLRVWMNLSHQVRLDAEAKYLTVYKSYCGIFSDEELETCLCHFDYEREKDKYTSAHLQVHGRSPALEVLNRRGTRSVRWRSCTSPWAGSASGPPLRTSSSSWSANAWSTPVKAGSR